MAKFSGSQASRVFPTGPIVMGGQSTLTYNFAPAVTLDQHSELYLLAVSNMVSEKTFYQSAEDRDSRFSRLVQEVTVIDPDFVENLVPYIRNVIQLRSCAVALAAEYCLAKGPNRRKVVNSAMARADDIAEFVGYWMKAKNSRTFPAGVQRGLGDAINRLYNDSAVLKYDGATRGIRMGDVLNLTHQKTPLGKFIVDRRFGNESEELPLMASVRDGMMKIEAEKRREYLKGNPNALKAAGVTWEFLSSYLPGGMDAEAWELAIPQMGYMALLRNLRNFDDAGISAEVRQNVVTILADPIRVAESRQFPYRFFSAYREVQTDNWALPLSTALDHSISNIPEFEGSTVVFVDVSGSMASTVSAKSAVRIMEVAALFGATYFVANPTNTRIVAFATSSKEVTPAHKPSPLKFTESILQTARSLGGGTDFIQAVNQHYNGEDRLVMFSDMQINPGQLNTPLAKYVHVFDLMGYGRVPIQLAGLGQYLYGGFNDKSLLLMKNLEEGASKGWASLVPSAPWKATVS